MAGRYVTPLNEFAPAHAGYFIYKKEHRMSRRCDLLNTGPMSGNNVSHSQVKTRRRFDVNLCNVTLLSQALGQKYRLRISAKTLRTVDSKGGLDEFLLATKNHKLTEKAKGIKKALQKKKAEVAA